MVSRFIGFFIFLLSSFIFSHTNFAGDLSTQLITELHKVEGQRGLLFQDNHLIQPVSTDDGFFVEILSTRGDVLANFPVEFNSKVRGILPAGKCHVLIYGIYGFSILNSCLESKYQTTYLFEKDFNLDYFAWWGGGNGLDTFYFTEPNEGIIVVKFSGNNFTNPQVKKIGEQISFTTNLTLTDPTTLWISTHFNVWKADLSTGERKEMFLKKELGGFKRTSVWENGNNRLLLISTQDENKFSAIDLKAQKPLYTMTLPGEPSGVVNLGKCVVMTTTQAKKVYFLNPLNGEQIAVWNANDAGDRLKAPSEIALDQDSKTVFLRSAYPCPTCEVTQSSLWKMQESDDATFNKCLN